MLRPSGDGKRRVLRLTSQTPRAAKPRTFTHTHTQKQSEDHVLANIFVELRGLEPGSPRWPDTPVPGITLIYAYMAKKRKGYVLSSPDGVVTMLAYPKN